MCKQTVRREDTQINRNVWDAFVLSRQSIGFGFDLFTDQIKISKYAALAVDEFTVLCANPKQNSFVCCLDFNQFKPNAKRFG